MKKYKSIIIYCPLLLLLWLGACKKYGYDHGDGYEYGEKAPTSSGGLTDSLENDFSKRDRAQYFPGIISAAEPRLTNSTVTLNVNFKMVREEDIKILQAPQPWYSTGCYVPAGEPVKIEVPAGQQALIAVIGGWTDNLTGIASLKRDPVITYQQQLRPGVNYVRNLYGGTLYFRMNGNVENLGTIPITVSGAARSADFVLGTTSDAEWTSAIKNTSVPWFQLRGKKIIFELPRSLYERMPITNPTALMEEWDRIIGQDIYGFKGLGEITADSLNKAPELPIRVIMDIQPRSGSLVYSHSGYPIVLQLDEFYYREITSLARLKTNGAIRTLFEIGNNNKGYTWTWNAISNTSANLFQLHMAKRLGINYADIDPDMKLAIDSGLIYVRKNKVWSSSFARDVARYKNYELIKLLPFLQLAEVYGYGILTRVDSLSRRLIRGMSEQEKINFFYINASKYAKTDLIPFFKAWAIYVSPGSIDSISAAYPYLDKPVYTYNPLTGKMDDITVPPPSEEIDRIGWTPIDFCCQESDGNVKGYAVSLLDGDPETFWSTRITGVTVNHKPHYVTIDMGRLNAVKGFWMVNRKIGEFTYLPQNIKVYLSSDNVQYNLVWEGEGWNTGGRKEVQFNSVFKNIRYIKFEAQQSWTSETRLNFSELGAFQSLDK